MSIISLQRLTEPELPDFRKRLQIAFSIAVIEKYGVLDDGPIPSDEDINGNFYSRGAESFHILSDGQKVGGVIVTIDCITNHNHLDFFFIDPAFHSKGLGLAAWKAIEAAYPETEIWETGTPYFEQRNIHFYVNKCGFKITEFYCKHHPDPHEPLCADKPIDGMDDGFFVFEKVMNPQNTEAQS
ncbi:MAG: GNAT family N-acetyltransferase [Oscillospiraceae bacterium]|nr:GNAT family N-acetyltransferase [Oscillospiraceae bacterium]